MSKNRNQNTPNQLAPGSSPGSGGGEKTKSNASCEQQVAHEAKPPAHPLGQTVTTRQRRHSADARRPGDRIGRQEQRVVALTLATHPSGESPVGVKNRPHRCGLLVRFFHELTFANDRRPQVPFGFTEGYKKAQREEGEQGRLF